MSFNKFKLNVIGFFDNIKQIGIDRKNRKIWREEIGAEVRNPNSKFNMYDMKISDDFKQLSAFIVIPENYQVGASDTMKYAKLREESHIINNYINEINWGEYFTMPKFYYIEDEIDTDEDKSTLAPDQVSCTYLAVWEYTDVYKQYNNFGKKLAAFVGINTAILGALITGLIVLL